MTTTSAALDAPQFELKHRVAGALILVALAVLVLPAVLDGSSDGEEAVRHSVGRPDVDTPSVFVSRVQPLGKTTTVHEDPVKATPRSPSGSTPAKVATATEVVPQPSAAIPSPRVDDAPAAATAASPPTDRAAAASTSDEPAIERGWMVQVGVFSKMENADRLLVLLRDAGFDARANEIKTDSGNATRVWVGPFEDRVSAARVRSDIEASVGEKGFIATYPQ